MSTERFSKVASSRLSFVPGIIVIDQHQCIAACNPESAHLLFTDTACLAGHPAADLPPPLAALVRDTFLNGRSAPVHQIQIGADPEPRILSVTVTLALDPTQAIQQVVLSLVDLAMIRQFEANMRQLDRLASIGTLSASMAHEIKNALVAVRTFVDLLLSKNQEAELAELVSRELRRIDSIVSQMLRFAGPARPTFAAVHLHEILDQSLRLIQHQLEGRKISLERAFQAAPETIKGDDYQLEQAFVNLFFNAIEAMGPSGILTVKTAVLPGQTQPAGGDNSPAPSVQVWITDTGMGIAPENLDRLFEPFFTTKPNGTGLGLAIARRIIQEHRGTIHVESRLNGGTTFRVSFPLPDTAARRQPQPNAQAAR